MKIIKELDLNSVEIACATLKAGGIISFATDTIYGVAADASNEKAVDKLYEIKKRDQKKPIAIFVKNLEKAQEIFNFDYLSTKLAKEFMPGAITLVLKTRNSANLAKNLNYNNDGFIGFRIVDREFITKLMNKFEGNLAVTSANISKQKSSTTNEEVKNYFKNSNLDLLIEGKEPEHKVASTVIKVENGKPEILRQGAINLSNENYI